MSIVTGNLEIVRNRIREVCIRTNRNPAEVKLVAVSKTFGPDAIREAAASGQHDFGESYAQEFRAKAIGLKELNLGWHFIGHLQSNKVKYIFDDACLIHSLDRLSLAAELQKRAEKADRVVDALVEVHTTDEASKSGLLPKDVLPFLRSIADFNKVRIKGLMTMGPFSGDQENARPCFRTVKQLQEQLRQEGLVGMTFETLSMGMTSDFEVAIEEGATMVRVGTAIFGARSKAQE